MYKIIEKFFDTNNLDSDLITLGVNIIGTESQANQLTLWLNSVYPFIRNEASYSYDYIIDRSSGNIINLNNNSLDTSQKIFNIKIYW